MSWAADEFKDIDLGDQRLDQRAILLAERLAEKPTASIPGAGGGWAETQAAYRFLAQGELDWRDIRAPHGACAQARLREQAVVLCIQDTTELDFNGQAMRGLGPLTYEAQRGLYLHATYAVTLAREPLGVLDAWMWARQPKDANGERRGIKESIRWTEGYERVAELAADRPTTRLVYVADREADIAALRAHPLPAQSCASRGREALGERDRGPPPGRGAPTGVGQAGGTVRRPARARCGDLPRGAGGGRARGGEAPRMAAVDQS